MSLNPEGVHCARCGEVAKGSAFIGPDRFCHGDDDRPSCYEQQQWDSSSAGVQANGVLLPNGPTPALDRFMSKFGAIAAQNRQYWVDDSYRDRFTAREWSLLVTLGVANDLGETEDW